MDFISGSDLIRHVEDFVKVVTSTVSFTCWKPVQEGETSNKNKEGETDSSIFVFLIFKIIKLKFKYINRDIKKNVKFL